MSTVDLNGVEKVYPNGFKAIHGIDLEIADGELLVLVGPSGCGKSTLLRMVAGLETITHGEARIDGTVVNNLEPADRDIAMVFQNYALYPHMTVFQNMAYGLRNRGTPSAEIQRRVDDAARILELDGLLDRRPRQLSGGQRRRVTMGRAIVREPKAFLFDEPLSNLDAKLRVQMRVEIKRLQRSLGTTSIYVTHDQVEAMTLADRLVVMNGGIAEQIGTPMELYERPATVFVAGFIGSPAMNLFAARLTADGSAVEVHGGETLVLANGGLAARGGQAVTLGVRPEHLEPAPADTAGTLQLKAEIIEPLGADTLIHGFLGDGADAMTVRLQGKAAVGAGDVLALAATQEHLHLFDPDTGVRIDG